MRRPGGFVAGTGTGLRRFSGNPQGGSRITQDRPHFAQERHAGRGALHQNTAARRKARLAAARRNVLVTAGLYTAAAQ